MHSDFDPTLGIRKAQSRASNLWCKQLEGVAKCCRCSASSFIQWGFKVACGEVRRGVRAGSSGEGCAGTEGWRACGKGLHALVLHIPAWPHADAQDVHRFETCARGEVNGREGKKRESENETAASCTPVFARPLLFLCALPSCALATPDNLGASYTADLTNGNAIMAGKQCRQAGKQCYLTAPFYRAAIAILLAVPFSHTAQPVVRTSMCRATRPSLRAVDLTNTSHARKSSSCIHAHAAYLKSGAKSRQVDSSNPFAACRSQARCIETERKRSSRSEHDAPRERL